MIGFLGPKGTFSEQAALVYNKNIERKDYTTIYDVLEACETQQIDFGVVPVENLIEGAVNSTIDAMIFDFNLQIHSEIVIPINHHLFSKSSEKPKKILSHPQALSQCKMFLRDNYGASELVAVNSTSEAAQIVMESQDNIASIGNKLCAEIYGLSILESEIQDYKGNETSFIVVSKIPSKTDADESYKATLAFSTENTPGGLYKILDIFSLWDINMTKIISRPMNNVRGEYVFFVDVSYSSDLHDAIKMVKRKTTFFKQMGIYKVDYAANKPKLQGETT